MGGDPRKHREGMGTPNKEATKAGRDDRNEQTGYRHGQLGLEHAGQAPQRDSCRACLQVPPDFGGQAARLSIHSGSLLATGCSRGHQSPSTSVLSHDYTEHAPEAGERPREKQRAVVDAFSV